MNKNITGAYVRVNREGKWQSIDIACLSDQELDEFFASDPDPKRWAVFLSKWIRETIAPALPENDV